MAWETFCNLFNQFVKKNQNQRLNFLNVLVAFSGCAILEYEDIGGKSWYCSCFDVTFETDFQTINVSLDITFMF